MTLLMKRRRKGFSLVEIMVVVIIIAVLATAVVLTVGGKPDEARSSRARSDINTIETALESFRLDMRRYPTEEEGLVVLSRAPDGEEATRWKGPYLRRLERDPWDNAYQYRQPGLMNEAGFDLFSFGADGQEGGEGYNADIGNWAEDDELLPARE